MRFRLFLATALLVPGAITGTLHAANAANYQPCAPGTVASYDAAFTAGNPCTIGILLFDSFSFSAVGTGSAVLDTASGITLTPAGNGFLFSQTSGTPFAVSTGQTASYTIGYRFVIDPAPVVGGADLSLDPPVGSVTITQTYCNDSNISFSHNGSISCVGGSPSAHPQSLTVTTSSPKDSITFDPPARVYGTVSTNIFLNGANGPAGFDSIDGDVNISGVPEPSFYFLLGGGLMGLVTTRLVRKR